MSSLDAFANAAGLWAGSNTLHDPNTGQPETTESQLRVEPVLNGRFHRMAYTWSYQGKPQAGEILVGLEKDVVTMAWIDTWHQSRSILFCRGASPAEGRVEVRGTFPAPPGPDWGWSIDLDVAPTRLGMTMHCHTPEGEAVPAVEAAWTRTAASPS